MSELNHRSERPSEAKVLLAAIVGHTFWGFSFMASRVALDVANMFVLLSHRFILAFFVMSLMIVFKLVKIDLKGKSFLPLIVLGLMEPVVYFFGELIGIEHSNTIFSGVMIAMIPIVSTLAAAPILKEMPSVGQLIFGAISVAGVIGIGLMSKGSGQLEFIGVIALAIAVIAAVAYTLLARGLSKEFSPFERTYSMMGMGALVFSICAIVYCRGDAKTYIEPLFNLNYDLAILFLGLCCSVGSYFMSSYALTHMTVAKETVFANLTTAVSVFAGAFFLHEPFSIMGVIFCIMILVGIYGVQRESKESK